MILLAPHFQNFLQGASNNEAQLQLIQVIRNVEDERAVFLLQIVTPLSIAYRYRFIS